MRRLSLFTALLAVACQSADADSGYLSSSSFRRQTLVESLVNPSNGYAQLRLARYETGAADDWARLPESNPIVARVGEAETPRRLDLAAADLGAQAFFRYPVQQVGDGEGFQRLVRATYDSGFTGISTTCASCHVRDTPQGELIGAPSATVDRGWGPGRLDVTSPAGTEPVAISDLRPVRLLTHLHHDGNVQQTGVAALAVRLETLIITSHAGVTRPPRAVTFALAQYVWSLADGLPEPPANDAPGAALFARTCGGCHDPNAGFTGPPIALSRVGTDPTVGLSPERGTGSYRVPSLRGVSSRGALLHDASVPGIEALLDPSRSAGGHLFGLQLDARSRSALLDYVRRL